jgi:hypothetical protein
MGAACYIVKLTKYKMKDKGYEKSKNHGKENGVLSGSYRPV